MSAKKQSTIADVARLAAVSTSTVSAVLNGAVPVSPKRKQRVLDAMAALNYQPDAIARGLKTGRTLVIGVVLPDITNAFYPELFRGVQDAAREAGYSVFLCDSNEDPSCEQDHLNMLSSRRVDGVLLACCHDSTSFASEASRRFPIVYVDRVPAAPVDYSVCSDNEQAGYMAARHLIELGHKRIAPIAGNLGLSPHHDRLEGFRKAMQEAHIAIRDEYMVRGDVQILDGRNACSQLLNLTVPPTALIAGNYKLLLGALQEIESRRMVIPQQISIIGFDDYVWNRYFNPGLTAVAQFTNQMGRRAFELLQKVMNEGEGQNSFERQVRLPIEIKVRNSTAPPRE